LKGEVKGEVRETLGRGKINLSLSQTLINTGLPRNTGRGWPKFAKYHFLTKLLIYPGCA
jgi:hypothetical protein